MLLFWLFLSSCLEASLDILFPERSLLEPKDAVPEGGRPPTFESGLSLTYELPPYGFISREGGVCQCALLFDTGGGCDGF